MKEVVKKTVVGITAMMVLSGGASASWMDEWGEREKRQYRRTLNQIKEINEKEIMWGKERDATPSTYVLLDPPLARPKLEEPVEAGHIVVEWFNTYLDPDGTNEGSKEVYKAINRHWIPDVHNNSGPIGTSGYTWIRKWIVTEGRGLDPYWNKKREQTQEIILGILKYLEEGASIEKKHLGNKIFLKWGEEYLSGYPSLNNEEDTRRIIKEAGESWKEWKRMTSEYVEERRKKARDRWELMAKRAEEQFEGVFDSFPHPIILIEGKYLLTLNTVRRQGGRKAAERLFQIANRLIREEAERKVFVEFKTEEHLNELKWDRKRKPEDDEVIELREPFKTERKEGEIEVQWLFTYITDDGRPKDNEWLEYNIGRWQDWLWEVGVDVRVTRGAIVSDQGHFLDHQRRHQRIANAWGKTWNANRHHMLHKEMRDYLAEDARGIGTDKTEREFIRNKVSNGGYELYVDMLISEDAKQRVRELQRKGQVVSELAKRSGNRRGPIFLVDGKYLVRTGSTMDTFQTMNWIIAKIMEEKG